MKMIQNHHKGIDGIYWGLVFSATITVVFVFALLFPPTSLQAASARFGSGYENHRAESCAWCGRTDKLEVHHIITEAHIRAMLTAGELTQEEAESLANHDPSNLITLCRQCHFVLGHKCNWHAENTNIIAMIKIGKGDTHVALRSGDPQVAKKESP